MKNSYLKRNAIIRIFHEDVYSLELRLDVNHRDLITLKYIIMKKFFSIIALSAMTMSLSSFENSNINSSNAGNLEAQVSCFEWARLTSHYLHDIGAIEEDSAFSRARLTLSLNDECEQERARIKKENEPEWIFV